MTPTKPHTALDKARRILDGAKAGGQYTEALRVTGDLPDYEYRRVVHKPVGTWETGACGLLAPACPMGVLA